MTHEQKPEIGDFRSREAQIRELCASCHFEEVATAHILEAEARGAAEQRRKDAALAQAGELLSFGFLDDGTEVFQSVDAGDGSPMGNPLYTRPANVAALEARVKELEADLAEQEIATARALAAQKAESAAWAIYPIEAAAAAQRERDAQRCEAVGEALKHTPYYGRLLMLAAVIREEGEHD